MASAVATKVLRADQVGSLLRPPELMSAMQAYEQGNYPEDRLKELQDRCIRDAVKLQEDVGLQSITDGEFRRRGWSRGFMDAVGGFTTKPGQLFFRSEDGSTRNPMPAAYLSRKLNRTKAIVADDFRFIRALTDRQAKVTMPTPSVFHIGLFGESFDHAVYPSVDAFFDDMVKVYQEEIADLGRAGCRFLQLDETQLAVLCDPANREIVEAKGQNADKLVDYYVAINNRLVQNRPDTMTIGMHLCRGNQAGLFIGSGGYEPVAERLFNAQDVAVYFLEYDSPRAGDFAPLRFVPKGRTVVLGLISTKNPRIESVDEICDRIDEAARYVPLDQLAISPQCGFASSISTWNVTKNPMTDDIQRRKLSLVLEVAEKVWG